MSSDTRQMEDSVYTIFICILVINGMEGLVPVLKREECSWLVVLVVLSVCQNVILFYFILFSSFFVRFSSVYSSYHLTPTPLKTGCVLEDKLGTLDCGELVPVFMLRFLSNENWEK